MINRPPLEKAELHTNPSLQSAAPGRQETAVRGAPPGWLLRQAGCPQRDRRAPASQTSLPEEGGEGDSSPGSLPLGLALDKGVPCWVLTAPPYL